MANNISVYYKNTLEVTCTVTGLDNLSGYTAYMTVKTSDTASTKKINKTGSITDLTITFSITSSDNDIEPGTYVYDVVIADDTNIYTIVQSRYVIKRTVKYNYS